MTKECENKLIEGLNTLQKSVNSIEVFLLGNDFNPGGFTTEVRKNLSKYNTKLLVIEEKLKKNINELKEGTNKKFEKTEEWKRKIDIIYYKITAASFVGGILFGVIYKIWEYFRGNHG